MRETRKALPARYWAFWRQCMPVRQPEAQRIRSGKSFGSSNRIRICDLLVDTRETEKRAIRFQSISRIDFDVSPLESHACPERTMRVETKFLRLFRAVGLGDDIEGWQVCWLGGWDKCRVLFVVMVKRVPDVNPMCRRNRS